MSNQIKTLGILSLVFGIVSLVLFCIPIFSLLLSFTGLLLGIIGFSQASKTQEPKGTVTSGLIISILAFLIAVVYNATIFGLLGDVNNFFDGGDWFNDEPNPYYDPYYDDPYYDPNDIDTNMTDVDSLLLDPAEINNLDNSSNDFDNGPGPAPN